MIVPHNLYKSIVDTLYDGVYFVDLDRRILFWNRGAERITGYEASAVVGKHCRDNILIHVTSTGENLCGGFCPLAKALATGCSFEDEAYLHHRNGHRIPVLIKVNPLRDSSDQIIGATEIFTENIPRLELRQRLEELQKLSLLDPLTELGNRRYTEINLHSRLNEIKRYGWQFGVLFIDIDHFKTINDSYGHVIGDKVLHMLALTLRNSLRASDTIGRWGGDEFLAIIAAANDDQLYTTANKVCVLIEQSSLFTGTARIQATVSIGATLAQPDDTVDTLLNRADQLLYHSKCSGRNRVSTKLPA